MNKRAALLRTLATDKREVSRFRWRMVMTRLAIALLVAAGVAATYLGYQIEGQQTIKQIQPQQGPADWSPRRDLQQAAL